MGIRPASPTLVFKQLRDFFFHHHMRGHVGGRCRCGLGASCGSVTSDKGGLDSFTIHGAVEGGAV
jgi:hypothetical protein